MRAITSSAIGEFIFTTLALTIVMTGEIPLHQLFNFILISFGLKLAISFILAIPSIWVIKLLKHSEKIDIYDHSVNFNPFKIKS